MDTQKLFTERITELENLSNCPSIFWYVSAGKDFRGPNFLTEHNINRLSKHHGKNFIKPELFVYNCLGNYVEDLKNELSNGDGVVLFSDDITTIKGSNFRVLSTVGSINLEPDLKNNRISCTPPIKGEEAFYFELTITGSDYSETQKILYFEAENIDFFHKIILKNIFNVIYLCATQTGSVKTIIEHIYYDEYPDFFISQGFRPVFNIISLRDQDKFDEKTEKSNLINVQKNYDHNFYRFYNNVFLNRIKYMQFRSNY